MLPNKPPMLFLSTLHFILILALLRPTSASTKPILKIDPKTQYITVIAKSNYRYQTTPSVYWDKVVQHLVQETSAGPTLSVGAYGTLHTALYDVWAIHDTYAKPSLKYRRQPRRPLILLSDMYGSMDAAAITALTALFPRYGAYVRRQAKCLRKASRAAKLLGIAVGRTVLKQYKREMKGNVLRDLKSSRFHKNRYTTVLDRWIPERVPIDAARGKFQKFVTPTYGTRVPFSVSSGSSFRPPPPHKFLKYPGRVNLRRKSITLRNGSTYAISKSLIGPVINPKFIAQVKKVLQYSQKLGSKNELGKMSAEFWEDGKGTSFPSGTWQTFTQYVSARDFHSVEQDVKLFFVVANSMRDAGILTWNAKYYYRYARPVRTIRQLGELGLIGRYDSRLRGYTIRAYDVKARRVRRILASTFMTYQVPGSDPSPPFPEYTSGHSAYSSSGGTALRLMTGSDFFGAELVIPKGRSRFEKGKTPRKDFKFRWRSFTEAAVQAGDSRLYGGIHFSQGNEQGRVLGVTVAKAVYAKAMALFRRGRRRRHRH